MSNLLIACLPFLCLLGLIGAVDVDLTIEKLIFSTNAATKPIDFSKLVVKRFNRTHKVVTGPIEALQDLGNDIEVVVEVFKKQGNEYRVQPYKLPRCTFCEFIQLEKYNYPQIVADSDLPPPDTCPVPKGLYTVRNHIVDVSKIPPYFDGQYWLRMKMYRENEFLDEMNGYFEIRLYST